MKIALVGCGKSKLDRPARVRDLYTGALFKLAYRYGAMQCDKVLILSAKHGVIEPDRVIAPYEVAMKSLTPVERTEWAARAREKLTTYKDAEFVFLAGMDYKSAVDGLKCQFPLQGLRIGRRKAWLKGQMK